MFTHLKESKKEIIQFWGTVYVFYSTTVGAWTAGFVFVFVMVGFNFLFVVLLATACSDLKEGSKVCSMEETMEFLKNFFLDIKEEDISWKCFCFHLYLLCLVGIVSAFLWKITMFYIILTASSALFVCLPGMFWAEFGFMKKWVPEWCDAKLVSKVLFYALIVSFVLSWVMGPIVDGMCWEGPAEFFCVAFKGLIFKWGGWPTILFSIYKKLCAFSSFLEFVVYSWYYFQWCLDLDSNEKGEIMEETDNGAIWFTSWCGFVVLFTYFKLSDLGSYKLVDNFGKMLEELNKQVEESNSSGSK